ncbi:hypothetical protein P3L51_00125 [Streptomyces sp. PSRA5]|uniref:hypothetical protein n=1 Tax=Streptomyces panacea TaxID=3035064 RepID=UPI00339BA04D
MKSDRPLNPALLRLGRERDWDMGLLPTVLISLLFPALMLLVTVALGRMEEFLLPHLRAPLPADGDAETRSENPPPENPPPENSRPQEDAPPAEESRAEEIRIAQDRAAKARAETEALRRAARRRAYGTPRPAGRTNTGPPRGARTTPPRFR